MISIIIPHLNQPEALERCLNSLASQIDAKPDTEIIVVDNGSRQLPSGICRKFPSVTLSQERTPGPGPARNHGISLSKGNILAFIDADCFADENWLAAIEKAFSSMVALHVVGGDVRIGYANKGNLTALEAYESVFAYRQQEYIENENFSGTGNLAMRRSAFEEVGPFAGIGIAEDYDWGQRANDKRIRIAYIGEMIVYHPARQTFAELTLKWDRHVQHAFNTTNKNLPGRLKWAALAAAVALSGMTDMIKVLLSTRVSGLANRIKAIGILLRIRAYRAAQMSRLIMAPPGQTQPDWNRK